MLVLYNRRVLHETSRREVRRRHTLAAVEVFEAADKPITEFRRYFERGDIPISVRHGAKCGLEWKVRAAAPLVLRSRKAVTSTSGRVHIPVSVCYGDACGLA